MSCQLHTQLVDGLLDDPATGMTCVAALSAMGESPLLGAVAYRGGGAEHGLRLVQICVTHRAGSTCHLGLRYCGCTCI